MPSATIAARCSGSPTSGPSNTTRRSCEPINLIGSPTSCSTSTRPKTAAFRWRWLPPISCVGRWTNYGIRPIDGPINPNREKSVRLFFSSPGATPSFWRPYRELQNLATAEGAGASQQLPPTSETLAPENLEVGVLTGTGCALTLGSDPKLLQ